ncbi:hypothetical protein GCM10027073_20340 [Streptomyces chlorus]
MTCADELSAGAGFNVGHAGSLAGNTPAERFRPELADRRVVKSLYVHLNRSQCHAGDPMHPLCNDIRRYRHQTESKSLTSRNAHANQSAQLCRVNRSLAR